MPKLKPGHKVLQVILPEDAHKALQDLAAELSEPGSRVSAGELARRSIERLLTEHGIEADTSVGGWGGNRRSDQNDDN